MQFTFFELTLYVLCNLFVFFPTVFNNIPCTRSFVSHIYIF